ncbi:MAG: hypothetical protein ACJ748_10890 [Flavisolibacter sp.]
MENNSTSSTPSASESSEVSDQGKVPVKSLKDYKSNLYNAFTRDISDFEKNFLLITSGLLAFSITFLKDIIKINEAQYLNLLFIGWALLVLSIGLMMWTFISSAYGSDEIVKTVDNFLKSVNKFGDEETLTREERSKAKEQIDKVLLAKKKSLKSLRFSAIFTLVGGLVVFGIFLYYNMTRSHNDSILSGIKVLTPLKTDRKLQLDSHTIIINDSTITIVK